MTESGRNHSQRDIDSQTPLFGDDSLDLELQMSLQPGLLPQTYEGIESKIRKSPPKTNVFDTLPSQTSSPPIRAREDLCHQVSQEVISGIGKWKALDSLKAEKHRPRRKYPFPPPPPLLTVPVSGKPDNEEPATCNPSSSKTYSHYSCLLGLWAAKKRPVHWEAQATLLPHQAHCHFHPRRNEMQASGLCLCSREDSGRKEPRDHLSP